MPVVLVTTAVKLVMILILLAWRWLIAATAAFAIIASFLLLLIQLLRVVESLPLLLLLLIMRFLIFRVVLKRFCRRISRVNKLVLGRVLRLRLLRYKVAGGTGDHPLDLQLLHGTRRRVFSHQIGCRSSSSSIGGVILCRSRHLLGRLVL